METISIIDEDDIEYKYIKQDLDIKLLEVLGHTIICAVFYDYTWHAAEIYDNKLFLNSTITRLTPVEDNQ